MRIEDLRDELEAIAADVRAAPGNARSAVRGGARRLWLRRGLSSVVALAVIVGAVVSLGHVDGDHHELSITAGSGPSVHEPAGPGLTAATIADGKWSAIAPFPLEARGQDVAIWTGSQLIVWGGESAPKVFGDGAAYDPDTNSWRVMPTAPIGARTGAAAVWTGREMIVWGGERMSAGELANDGAAFDPVTWKWRRIAASPLAPRYGAHMLWTGSDAIVVGGSESNTDATTVLDAASYDPAADRWQRIASLPRVPGSFIDLRTVWTGREVLAWELSAHTAGTLTTVRALLVEYDPNTGKWQRGPATGDPHRNVFGPIWTGHEVVVAAAPPLCDYPDGAQNCGPPPTNVHGSVFDPATGVWRSMPQGPADNGADASVWTGADLVVLSGGAVDPLTDKTIVAPGSAAAWNPTTNQWTVLPRSPFGPGVETTIWTGREILAWGTVTDSHTGRFTSRGAIYSAQSSGRAPVEATSQACAASSAVSADVDGDGRSDRVYLRWNGSSARLGVCTSTGVSNEVACPGMAQDLAIVTLPAQPAVILCGGTSVAELDLAPYVWQGGALHAAALPNADHTAFSSGRGGTGFSNIEQFGCPRIGNRRVMAQLTIEFAGSTSSWTRRAYTFDATGAHLVNTSSGTVHGRLSQSAEDALVPACPVVAATGTELRPAG